MKNNYLKMLIAVICIVLLANSFAGASETDERIESSFKKSFVFKSYLNNDSITIKSIDGNVTLTGTVKEESHNGLARETAASLPGVKKVDNQLVFIGTPLEKKSDKWLMIKVRTALLFHKSVNSFDVDIETKNGVVFLKGKAKSSAQKDLAEEYAKDVSGVKEVNNMMTISEETEKSDETISEVIDDASITAQIKMALLSHHSTSMLKTNVETIEGVVTLSGTAKNEAEKTLVSKLVNDIKGVKKVINKMTIDTSLSKM